MRPKLILYVGEHNEHTWLVRLLAEWSMQHPEIDFLTESIHTNPAKVVQLRVSQLPALIFDEHILAQGDPMTWVPRLLDQVLITNSYRDG